MMFKTVYYSQEYDMNGNVHYAYLIKIPLLFLILSIVLMAIGISCGGSDDEGGFDPNYKPPSKGSDTASLYGVPVASPGSKKGNKYFDPSAESSSTAGKLATKLSANCGVIVDQMKVSCEAHRTSMQSTLRWSENATNTEMSGEEEGIFEFDFTAGSDSKVTVSLEECIATTCKEVGTDVFLSNAQ